MHWISSRFCGQTSRVRFLLVSGLIANILSFLFFFLLSLIFIHFSNRHIRKMKDRDPFRQESRKKEKNHKNNKKKPVLHSKSRRARERGNFGLNSNHLTHWIPVFLGIERK